MPDAKAPAQPPAKGNAATPKLNSEMELGALNNGGSSSAASTTAAADEQKDIMHIARVGDVPAMEALFAEGELDATYTDAEGITPLHVSSFLSSLRSFSLSVLASLASHFVVVDHDLLVSLKDR